jgi:plasmid stability protein
MPAKKYRVRLSATQRMEAEQISRSTKHSIRERVRARILLAADEQQEVVLNDEAIGAQVRTSLPTIARVRQRFAAGGLTAALYHKEQAKRRARRVDGAGEAHLLALVCGTPPEGHKQWTLRLLTDQYIEVGYTDQISHETIRQVLKKMNLSLG